MANLRSTDSPSPGRTAALGQWLFLLIAVCAAILWGGLNDKGADPRPGAQAWPLAQIGQDDYGKPICSVVYSPDDTYLATATMSGDVWLKDLATGQSSRIETGIPEGYLHDLPMQAFSRDGRLLAVVGTGPAVRFWDVETQTEQEPLPMGEEATRSIAFVPDGAVLAVGLSGNASGDAVVTLWDYGNRRRLAVLAGHRGSVGALAFSPDGVLLASGDSEGLVKLWDVSRGGERTTLPMQQRGVTVVSFSPDGTTLATSGAAGSSVRLWDAASGAPRDTLPTASRVFAFAPDGKMLITAEPQTAVVTLWEVGSARKLGMVRTGGGLQFSVAFSGHGKMLATGGEDGKVRVWDVARVLGSAAISGR